MRFRLAVSLAVAAAVVGLAAGQDKPKIDTKDVTFDTSDGVELQGTLYKSAKGGTSPVVILVHSFGADPNKGDWGGLANTLAAKGFSVLRFDLRGHGKSTIINPKKFFADPMNVRHLSKLEKAKPQASKLTVADMKQNIRSYFPQLANDVMAARVALDKMNDGGDVNTSSVYLIGATDAATLCMLYMTAEWGRLQALPPNWVNDVPPIPFPQGASSDPSWAGRDIAGAVFLSPVRHISVDESNMKAWVSKVAPDVREKNPVLCLYGSGDRAGKEGSKFFVDNVLVANPPKGAKTLVKLDFTEAREIKDTKNVGVDLLGNQLKTEEAIIGQLELLEKDRKNAIRTPNRNYTKPPPITLSVYVR